MSTRPDRVSGTATIAISSASCHAIIGATTHADLARELAGALKPLGVDGLALSQVCEGTNDLEFVAAWGTSEQLQGAVGSRYSRDTYPGMSQVTALTPFISDDVTVDERLAAHVRESLVAEQVRALALYPIASRGQLTATLGLLYRSPRVHGPDELRLLELLVALASTALAGIEGQARNERQLRRWKAMRHAAEVLGAMSDEDELLAAAAKLMIDGIGMVDAFVGTVDEAAGRLCERASAGASVYPGREPLSFPLEDRHVDVVDVVFTGEPKIIRDPIERAELQGWGEIARAAKLRNAVVAPLRAGGTALGAIGAGQALVDIGEDDQMMFSTFANLLATAISRVRADAERQCRVEELEAAYTEQARLLETVRELSTPVMPVHDGVLVLPLIGAIDTARGEQIMVTLLDGIERTRAKIVICDVTGVPNMDSAVANILLRSMRATTLLGATTILVGISPIVAQTLVSLGVELGGITTCRNLQVGIDRALSMIRAG